MFNIICNDRVIGTAATHAEAIILTMRLKAEHKGLVYFVEAE